jgi:hypothetical protein
MILLINSCPHNSGEELIYFKMACIDSIPLLTIIYQAAEPDLLIKYDRMVYSFMH